MKLSVTFLAFGFKFGLPAGIDMLFDVRFLRNPYYDAALSDKSGDDPAVAAFIESDPALAPFLEKVTSLLDFLMPRYHAEGRTHLTIGIGCTGGRHRSVYVSGRLAEHFAGDDRLNVVRETRDLERAA